VAWRAAYHPRSSVHRPTHMARRSLREALVRLSRAHPVPCPAGVPGVPWPLDRMPFPRRCHRYDRRLNAAGGGAGWRRAGATGGDAAPAALHGDSVRRRLHVRVGVPRARGTAARVRALAQTARPGAAAGLRDHPPPRLPGACVEGEGCRWCRCSCAWCVHALLRVQPSRAVVRRPALWGRGEGAVRLACLLRLRSCLIRVYRASPSAPAAVAPAAAAALCTLSPAASVLTADGGR
jgi:hypothetical protein